MATGNPYLDALIGNYGPAIRTYYFDDGGPGGTWTIDEQTQFRAAAATWSTVANIHFVEVPNLFPNPNVADARELKSNSLFLGNLFGAHDGPDTFPQVGEFNTDEFWTPGSMQPGGIMFEVFVHEIGHAIGLEHPHDRLGGSGLFPGIEEFYPSGNPIPTAFMALDQGDHDLNQVIYTVMSYNQPNDPAESNQGFGFAAGPMAFDIAAVQQMYGAVRHNDGNTVYVLADKSQDTFLQCIWDTSGYDTIAYYGRANAVIDLRSATLANDANGGGFVSRAGAAAYTIAADFTGFIPDENGDWGVIIEEAVGGSGNDHLYGNGVDNTLWGNGGDDHLNGFGGSDRMVGGRGNDEYVVSEAGDTVVETANGGTKDKIYTSMTSFDLDARGAFVEELQFIGTGNFTGYGNTWNNILVGASGDDILDGRDGYDTLVGGAGHDTYYLYDVSPRILSGGMVATRYDAILENPGEGIDRVFVRPTSLTSYTLAANVEMGEIDDPTANGFTLTGNNLKNRLSDGAGWNTLNGAGGDDTLSGGGGLDTLIGGRGDDIYFLEDLTAGFYDLVQEDAAGGNDTVYLMQLTATSYRLTENVEVGQINDPTANDFTLFGNSGANRLYDASGMGSNTLIGGGGNDELHGGGGFDILIGGTENDTYYLEDSVDAEYDRVIETADGGNKDTVRVSPTALSSYTLAPYVEYGLVQGEGTFTLIGNDLNNRLTGNDSFNVLVGGDGKDMLQGLGGLDILIGGLGNDIYLLEDFSPTLFVTGPFGVQIPVEFAYDTVIENAGEGTDLVSVSSLSPLTSYTLGANIENGEIVGDRSFTLIGNELANTLTGNDAANTLTGGGENDRLEGREGDDTAVFSGLHTQYEITQLSATSIRLRDLRSGASDGTDTAIDIEQFRFADGTFSFNGLLATPPTKKFAGTPRKDSLQGTSDTDIIQGLGDEDQLFGFDGTDFLYGGAGKDALSGGAGADTLDGGGGFDTADYSASPAAVTVNLATGTGQGGDAEGDTLISIERVVGSAFDDQIVGTAGAETLEGRNGNDVLYGGGGADTLLGGFGNDSISYRDGVGRVDGGDGFDHLLADESTDATGIHFTVLGSNFEAVGGRLGNDVIDARGLSYGISVTGYGGNDTFYGGNGIDVFEGGDDADTFVVQGNRANYVITQYGGDGNSWLITDTAGILDAIYNVETINFADAVVDTSTLGRVLSGNPGDDTLIGAAGNDTIEGGAGNDTLSGGAGQDTFVFNLNFGRDTVTDFTSAGADHDVIQVSTALFADWDAIIAADALTDVAGNATLQTSDGLNAVTFVGVTSAQLMANHANDFVFV